MPKHILTSMAEGLETDAVIKLILSAVNINKTRSVSRQAQAKVNQHPLPMRNVSDQAHFKPIPLLIGALKGYNTQLGGLQYNETQHPSPFRCGVKKKIPSERRRGALISIHQTKGRFTQTRKMPVLN